MENITIGQIVSSITILTIIITFLTKIIVTYSKWYKSKITDKFVVIDKKIEKIEGRLEYVEYKSKEYEEEVKNSKCERKILMGGLLAALKGLKEMGCNNAVDESIDEIEDYMMDKTH